MSCRKLRYSFAPDILDFTLEAQKLTKIEHIASFELKISIRDVFAVTPFNNMKGSQLMIFRMHVIQLRILWKLGLKLKLMNLLRSMLNK